MNVIHAGQHIYGNVEKVQSPSNIGCFQTLFYTKDFLSPSELADIERRMGYYFSEENPEKVVFFRVGDKHITTQLLPLPDVDKFGRKGLFIAHSFIFLQEDIEKFNYNPFVIFDLFKDLFVKTTSEDLCLVNLGDQNILPVKITLDDTKLRTLDASVINAFNLWNPNDIKKLIYLIINEGKNTGESSTALVITGNQSAIHDTINIIFSFIPDVIRSTCTFDTYFLGCNPIATKYRIYCYPTLSQSSSQFTQVNADTKTVPSTDIDTGSPYTNWILNGRPSVKTEDYFTFRNTAFELDQYLSNQSFDKEKIVKEIKSPNLEIFLELNQGFLRSKIPVYFSKWVSENLVKSVSKAVAEEYALKPNAVLLEKLLIGFDQKEIAHLLFNELKDVKSPNNQEIDELKEFLVRTDYILLRIVYLKWIKDFKTLSSLMKSLTDDEYKIAIVVLVVKSNANADTHPTSGINTGSPYMNWLLESGISLKINEICAFRNTAFELDQYLLNQRYNKEIIVKELKSPNLERFLKINRTFLRAKIPQYFNELVPQNLVKYVIKPVTEEYFSKPDIILLEKLLIGFDQKENANYLFNELKDVKSPKRQEIKELHDFLARTHHPLLQIVYLKWTNNPKSLPGLLKSLTDDEYLIAINILLGSIEFQSLLIEPRLALITDTFIQKSEENKDLRKNTPELIKMFFISNQEILLQNIIPLLPKLNRTELIAIQNYIIDQPDEKREKVPAEFTQNMNEILEKTPQKKSMLSHNPIRGFLAFFKNK